jgi:23S rRNA (guanosine2251-2'-O)-methyltransferase
MKRPDRKPRRRDEPAADREKRPYYKPLHAKPESGLWLYGLHATRSALSNPKRFVRRALLTVRAAEEIGPKLLARVRHEVTDMHGISRILPDGAVHQGIAILCEPLPRVELDAVLEQSPGGKRIVLVLDQITDPHNAGAILRTAAAFGVSAIVVQDRHSPPESGVLAKAASGALDLVPIVHVVNIARTLEDFGRRRYWRVALTADGEGALKDVGHSGDIVLVLGSEGAGVRRLVRERCDVSAYLPIEPAIESLNVSNAAAVALYELRRSG